MDKEDKLTTQQKPNGTQQCCKNSACLFFGSAQTEGYCSVCYKEVIKGNLQSQPQNTDSNTVGSNNIGSNKIPQSTDSSLTHNSNNSIENKLLKINNVGNENVTNSSSSSAINIPQTDKSSKNTLNLASSLSSNASGSLKLSSSPISSSPGKKIRRRCGVCKKKIGLTGFECRCGHLYCSLHRYADMHNCTFDYQTLAKEMLRKDNPVVEDAKIEPI